MSQSLPPVPLTLEGASVLHQMVRLRWEAWRALTEDERNKLLREVIDAFSAMGDTSGIFSLFGHKGDLMFIHFRNGFEALGDAEWQMRKLGIWAYLEQTTSYVSALELGLYESTAKTYASLAEQGVEVHSEAWKTGIAEILARQAAAMEPRLYPAIPSAKYACFYPMDRKRGEDKNWYSLPLPERQAMMHEHGMIGRRYAGVVRQIISASIGLDDWEWGVDLFAEDPLVFKKLIYEMRFDPVSAIYALFGTFYVGIRKQPGDLATLLAV